MKNLNLYRVVWKNFPSNDFYYLKMIARSETQVLKHIMRYYYFMGIDPKKIVIEQLASDMDLPLEMERLVEKAD